MQLTEANTVDRNDIHIQKAIVYEELFKFKSNFYGHVIGNLKTKQGGVTKKHQTCQHFNF